MQVNINPKRAAKAIANLVAECGGRISHAQSLEAVARLMGYAEYRALKAADTGLSAKTLLDEPLVDWSYRAGNDVRPEQQARYQLTVEYSQGSPCLRILVAPKHDKPEELDGCHALDMLVEINEGQPCVHLTNTPYSDMVLSVFAHRKGLYVRPESHDVALRGGLPADAELARFIETVQRGGPSPNACFIESDNFCGEADDSQSAAEDAWAPDEADVAEWVGLHYGRNYDAESPAQKQAWMERYKEMHREPKS